MSVCCIGGQVRTRVGAIIVKKKSKILEKV